jgi:hypothetical protein
MTREQLVFKLWQQYGWNVEPPPVLPDPEAWCHGFEGPCPEPAPEEEVKVERGTER